MPIPKQQDVQQALESFEAVFREVVLAAWKKWWALPDRHRLYQRTRACFVHNHMMLEALDRLAAVGDVHPMERHESVLFLINGSVVVRFKKGDEEGLSSNIPTQAALAFNDPQESLTDLPDVARVDVSYVLNDLGTQIIDILVVARNRDEVLWAYSIFASAAGTAEVISFPNPDNNLPAPDSGMRIPGEHNNKNTGDTAEE